MGNMDEDITVNLKNNEYVLTNAVIDPVTKSNISTYIVKDNVPISFNLVNNDINRDNVHILNFYYRTYKNKSLIIRCFEGTYAGGKDINVMPYKTYEYLAAKKGLNDYLIIFRLNYSVTTNQFGPRNEDENPVKTMEFAFKIVSDEEFEMYKKMEAEKNIDEENGVIKRPKKRS